MPIDYRAPNINARRLGLYLRRIREFLDLSYEQAAAQVGCESEWLVRVETGFTWPSPAEAERMLERYRVREAMVADVVVDLASRPAGPEWLAAHVDRLKASERDVLIMESEASVVHTYGVQTVPHLLRAEGYARELLPHQRPGCDVDEEWNLLSSRQRHQVGDRRRRIDAIIDECALSRTPVGPEVMIPQIRHLLDLNAGPDVTVRMIPGDATWYEARLHPFDVLEFPEVEDRLTLVHHVLGTDFAPEDLTPTWTLIEDESTLPADESRDLLHRIFDRLTAAA